MTFAGEKKCMPTTRPGSPATPSAMASMESVDVFDARTQAGFVWASRAEKIARFDAENAA